MDKKYAICVLETIGSGLRLSNEKDKELACIEAIKSIATICEIMEGETAEKLASATNQNVFCEADILDALNNLLVMYENQMKTITYLHDLCRKTRLRRYLINLHG